MKTYCFFSAHHLPYLGGVERYTHNIANALRDAGNRVIIVTSEMEGEPDVKLDQGIEIIRVKSWHFMQDRLPVMKWNQENKKVFQYLKEQNIDYVICNTKFYPLILVASGFAKRNKIPAIVIEHGTGHLKFDHPAINFVGEVYEHAMARLIYRRCPKFVGVSKECNEWLMHFGIKAIGVLYNAIDYQKIQGLMDKEVKRTRDIVYTGRLLKEKGICKLIDAFYSLKDGYEDVRLIVVGDGPIYGELVEKYAKDDRIIFTGKVDFERVVTILSEALIFCFPTDYPEGLPTCVLEAMAAGLYVITSKSGGAKEVITEKKYGVILEENTFDEIKKEIEYALAHEEETEAVRNCGKEHVKRYFDWSHTKNELSRLMGEIEKNEY